MPKLSLSEVWGIPGKSNQCEWRAARAKEILQSGAKMQAVRYMRTKVILFCCAGVQSICFYVCCCAPYVEMLVGDVWWMSRYVGG